MASSITDRVIHLFIVVVCWFILARDSLTLTLVVSQGSLTLTLVIAQGSLTLTLG